MPNLPGDAVAAIGPTHDAPNPDRDSREALNGFVDALGQALRSGDFVRLTLAKPRDAADDRRRVLVRPVVLKGEPQLSFVHTHKTRDVTKNVRLEEAVEAAGALIETCFLHAHLSTATDELRLLTSKKGRRTLLRRQAAHAAPPAAHDRAKHRHLELDRPFLTELGVTDPQHRLVPAMARKWKQIDKFVEILDHALDATGLKTVPRLDVVDFGSGKGYLTFATHDHLRALGLAAQVTGVELRPDMVALCNGAAERLGLEGLRFEEGDVRTVVPEAIDVMIALHACDTATDFAIATGVRAGAGVIVCSPCCHKELRPQLLSPHPLRPILKHGVHLGQQAEMLTDGLRALLLEACGYDTQVFEFVSTEHTQKNKMILAQRRASEAPAVEARRADQAGAQIDALKRFYGIREQCLERLLRDRLEARVAPG